MSERKLRRMSRTELIDVIDTLRQDETPQETEALRRVDAERERLTERRRFWRVLRGTVSTLIVVAAIAVLLATLLLPVLQVSGDSMNPTLQDRDVILLVKTDDWKTGDLCGFYWQNKLLLKRIIGGPGDVISIDTKGVVSVNGEVLDEPYVDELALGECDIEFPYQVPESRYFVMGDHRVNTRESQKHVRVTADATRIDPIITAPVIALPMLAVLLIWLLVTTRKRPKAGKHEKTTRGDPHETNS